ncbi:MAG: NAD-dependent epimerase/dehydratase family protein [Planctomycetota bacterium]|nr:NAD-dependent epimerase/dehydratase family protein [Planctomycetota bacterium]
MPEKILLTGGRGFFGRRIAEALRGRGHEVHTPGRPDFDLLDAASVRRTLNELRPHTVVHSAAYYGGLGITMAEPARIFHDNTLMTVNLLGALQPAGVKRFMSVGSACAYPGRVDGNMNEDDYWAGPLHPSVEAYGFSKKIQYVGARAYAKAHGLKALFPQITNLYGEHDVFTEYRSHVAAALLKKFADAKLEGRSEVVCWGTGAPVREFMYSGDAAEALARLLETDYDQPLNVGTGLGTSIRELSELTAKVTGFEGRIVWDTSKPDGVARKVLDVSRMKKLLNWSPPTALEAGLRKTVAWYLAHKEEADARA